MVEDFRLVGCYFESFGACSASRDKVLDVRANDTTVRHLDVSQRGGRNGDAIQCMQIASDSGQLTGVRIEFTKAHSCGNESSGNHDHGLYCRNALRPVIVGNWLYDNEGFGIQMYPNCDGADAVGNVVAENGAACNLSGDGSGSMTNGRATATASAATAARASARRPTAGRATASSGRSTAARPTTTRPST